MTIAAHEIDLSIATPKATLPGTLAMPVGAKGVVIFAHGSGSSRLSPRNMAVAQSLLDRGLGTVLFDLLTVFEAHDRRNVFNIELLADRMLCATRSVREHAEASALPVGYFGASTGAAAALVAAAELREGVAAVVSRGGRPDLAGDRLPQVTAPTLLLVGSLDEDVLELNRQAQSKMRCECDLVVVPGASHLFEEPGTLEQVARLAGQWFADKFSRA